MEIEVSRKLALWFLFCLVIFPGMATATSEKDLRTEARKQTRNIREGGASWDILETEFFRIRFEPGQRPDAVACLELDRFVAETQIKLGVVPRATDALRAIKLDYYLCSDAMVQKLTGYLTKGMADLSGRAVISSHFPHFHELAHLLVDLQMDESVTQTLPIVQEGLACLLGGRWGRSPEVVLYSGWVHHSLGMGTLNEVLTHEDYYHFSQGADVAYPLGTALCEVVRQEAGWAGVMDLYNRVSGSIEYVQGLSQDVIFQHIAAICLWPESGVPERLAEAVEQVLSRNKRCGIIPVNEQLQPEPARLVHARGDGLSWLKVEEGLVMEFRADKYPVYVLGPAGQQADPVSSHFREHHPQQPYRGQRYGLKISPEEVALYDYATNQLLATWVAGFTGELGACGDAENGVRVGITQQWAEIVGEILMNYQDGEK